MAKKKTIIEEQIPDGQSPDTAGTIWGDDDDVSEQLKQQYGVDIRVKIYKVVPGISQPRYCYTDATENFKNPEETLQNSGYGGGKYVVVWINNENKRLFEKTYEIADRPVSEKKEMTVSDIQIQMLREQSQMNRDLLMAVLGRSNGSSPLSEVAQMWNIMKGTPGGGGGALETMLTLFTKGLELGASKSGDMDWKTALIQTGKDMIPPILNLTQSIIARNSGNGNGQPIPMNPPSAMYGETAMDQNAPTPAREDAQAEQILKASLGWIKQRIMQGFQVSLAFEWIINNANDPQWQPLIKFVMAKTPEEMAKLDSELANEPFKSWIMELQKALKEHYAEQLSDEGDDNDSD